MVSDIEGHRKIGGLGRPLSVITRLQLQPLSARGIFRARYHDGSAIPATMHQLD